jgi:DNA invertase Pin-like site-specific DNA recombinase
MIHGYARFSTDRQSLKAQAKELKAAGAEAIVTEYASAAYADRNPWSQRNSVLEELTEDDVLLVTRLDRVARSTRELLNVLVTISARKAKFRSLGEPWADTTTADGSLSAVLDGLLEFDREMMRTRTSQGRARAVARGVKMGRKPRLDGSQQRDAIKRYDKGDETLAEIGQAYGVSGWTIGRLVLARDAKRAEKAEKAKKAERAAQAAELERAKRAAQTAWANESPKIISRSRRR